MSRSHSDAFLHTAREPFKQRRLNLNNAKQISDLIQFVTTDLLDYVFQTTDPTVKSRTCGILFPYYRKLRKPRA